MGTSHEVLQIAPLLLEPQSWINRRVEQVAYLDQKSVRRHVTVDFTVPSSQGVDGTVPYVPIAQLSKEKLVNFDLRDAHGDALTMLTAEQSTAISASILLSVALLQEGDDVDLITEKHIPRLVAGDEDERALAWQRIFPPGPVGERMLANPGLKTLATELRDNFVLYLPVSEADAGTRKIIKFAFDGPRPSIDPKGLSARMGWSPVPDGFGVPLAGYGASYHFELEAPRDMEVTSGRFEGARNGERVYDSVLAPTRRAHFALSRVDRDGGSVTVLLRARSRELLGGAALFSAVNAAVLLFVLLRLKTFLSDEGIDAIAAAILVIPGLLVGYLARPSEHALLTSFLSDLRVVAMVSAATSYAGALVLFAYDEATLKPILGSLFGVAVLASLALIRAWLARLR